MQGLQLRHPNIRYNYKPRNGGVDADLAEAVELATGEYCWLMSSDDLLADGAVDRMLREIESMCAVYLCCRIDCDRDMNIIGNQHWLPRKNDSLCFDLSDAQGMNHYLDEANTLGALFSYVPSVIVDRKAWLSVKGNEALFGTNYAHVHRLFSVLRSGSKMKYVDSPLVLCRMDNDSFSDKGLVHRYEIDFEGYLRISGDLFADNEIAKTKFLKVVRDEHRWYRLLVFRSHMQDQEEWNSHNQLLRSFGYGPYVLAFCGFIGRFRGLVSLAVRARRAIARS
jgi:abequosyltransferase